MKNNRMAILSLMLVIVLAACVATQKNIFETSQSQVALRSIQSRVFDFKDRSRMLRTIIATLQDLGFVIDNADETLGTVSGTKLAGYVLRMTVSVRPKGQIDAFGMLNSTLYAGEYKPANRKKGVNRRIKSGVWTLLTQNTY